MLLVRALASSALLARLSAGSALAVDVTTCGQVVRGTGDLDCSSYLGRAGQVIGRLRLNGGNSAFPVVFCNIGSCVVVGRC